MTSLSEEDKQALQCLSPLDGRYFSKTQDLREYFSESAWIRLRIELEIDYLIALCEQLSSQFPRTFGHLTLSGRAKTKLRRFQIELSESDVYRVKEIEATTRHEIKAVEYYIKEVLSKWCYDGSNGSNGSEDAGCLLTQRQVDLVHWALTSQDINSQVYVLSFKQAIEEDVLPTLEVVINALSALAASYIDQPMLARTHGQAASPTRLGKELAVFTDRLHQQLEMLRGDGGLKYYGKFGGAVGNFNAHQVALPEVDWPKFADKLLKGWGLVRNQRTTQIDHYDGLVAHFDLWRRVNTILIDLCRDIWTYISLDYFKQQVVAGEVGSSTMPHKVNPIDFENAEGNLIVANALWECLARKLPVSRMQRDLSDSTVVRNIGVALGHTVLAYQGIVRGLRKLQVNRQALQQDLDNHWEVIGEAIQTVAKLSGVSDGYEQVKELTRGFGGNPTENQAALTSLIDGLPLAHELKERLKKLSPSNYLGIRR